MELILLILLLLLSAFFSGSETAILSARRMKLEAWVRQGRHYARQTLDTIHQPESFLITTLVGNNIVVVAASTLMAIYLSRFTNGVYITLISTTVLLLCGEILPKSIAADKATSISLISARIMRFFYILLYPFIGFARIITKAFFKWLRLNVEQKQKLYTRKDIDYLVREGQHKGHVKSDYITMISRFILHGELSVRDIMIPRMDMTAVQQNIPKDDLVRLFEKTGYSRIPVYKETIDHIVGIYVAKDILLQPDNLLRPVIYVPEIISIVHLLQKIRESGSHLAVVVDEYGGTAGIITLEDIIEAFFGEIQDEYDEDITLYRKVTRRQIDVRARVDIHELNQKFKLRLPTGDYQTAAGLIMQTLGRIPRRGEKINFETCSITVLSCTRKAILWIRIIKKEE